MNACKDIFLGALNNLLSLVTLTKSVIDQFFPGITVTATVVGTMNATAKVQPPIFVLLKWIQVYPGTVLVPTDVNDLKKLRNLYISMGLDWEDDPFLLEGMLLGII
jgi:hypothetical protein